MTEPVLRAVLALNRGKSAPSHLTVVLMLSAVLVLHCRMLELTTITFACFGAMMCVSLGWFGHDYPRV